MQNHLARFAVLALGLTAAVVLSPAAAFAATNLIQNPGFETLGTTTQTMFSDTLADMSAWTVTSGGATASGGVLTPTGARKTSDIAVITGSDHTTNGTFQVQGIPTNVVAGLSGGLVFRYQGTGSFYACTVTSNALQLVERDNGVDTVLKSSAMSVQAGLPGWLRVTATGSSLTCAAYSNSNNAPATLIASVTTTDTTYTYGAVGVYDTNTTNRAGKMLTFDNPTITGTGSASWGALTFSVGTPGETVDTVQPNTGTTSLRLYAGASTDDGYVAQTGIAVTANSTYTLSASIATAGLSAASGAQVIAIESPSNTQTVLSSSSATAGYTFYSTTFTTRTNTTSVAIRVRLLGAGTANFDDLSLAAANTVTLALNTATVGLGTISPLTSPLTLLSATTATVVSNAGWTLAALGTGPFTDGAGGHSIALSALAWRRNGTTTFTPFTTTATTVTTGNATTASGVATPVDYRLTVGYSDPASSTPYSTTITYVATTP